jgi:thiol-disulfide isomerase/thioredoxin
MREEIRNWKRQLIFLKNEKTNRYRQVSPNIIIIGRHMKRLIILFLLTSLSIAQERDDSFITSKFLPGLPKELPFKWTNTSYVKINSGGLFRSIFIVSRNSFKTSGQCVLIVNEKEDFSVSDLKFSDKNKSECTVNLTTEDQDEIAPLKLILNLDKKEINYKWENEKQGDFENPTIIKESDLKIGKTFPIIKLKSKDGEWTNRGKEKMIVINWWATSCIACREEIPGLNKLVEKYKGREIEFVAIVNDKKNLAGFLKKYQFNYLQGYSDADLSFLFGVKYPRNIIIDKNGKIIYNASGGLNETYKRLDGVIESVL